MFKKKIFFILLSCFMAAPSWAVVDIYEFDTALEEERYKHFIAEIRCPKCLNANLAASDAAIAADLRAEIHDQIIQGQNDVEIMAFLTERYGEFITYRPPLNKGTILLWFGPGLLLIFGFFIVLRMMRNSQVGVSDSNLSDEETQKLQDILSSHSDQSGS